MRTIAWKKKGSKKEIYDCTVKVDDEKKLIVWIDCTCWNFVNRRLKSIGECADKKTYANSCKHLKPVVDALIKVGFNLKKPTMEGPDKLTVEVKRGVIERSGGTCEVLQCQVPGQSKRKFFK